MIHPEPLIFWMLGYPFFGLNSWQHFVLEFINHDSHTSVASLPAASRLQQQADGVKASEPKATDSRPKTERPPQEQKFSSVRQSAWRQHCLWRFYNITRMSVPSDTQTIILLSFKVHCVPQGPFSSFSGASCRMFFPSCCGIIDAIFQLFMSIYMTLWMKMSKALKQLLKGPWDCFVNKLIGSSLIDLRIAWSICYGLSHCICCD